jgi:hypothetical protein
MLHSKGNFQRVFNKNREILKRNVFVYCIRARSITVNDALLPADFFSQQFFEHLQIVPAGLLVFGG